MKKLITMFCLIFLMQSTTVLGIADDGVNSLGVYFDDGVFEQVCTDYSPFTTVNLYFVLANCSQSSIGGFEFNWRFEPDPVGQYAIQTVLLPANALNIGNLNNMIVGLGYPYPAGDAAILAIAQIMFFVEDLALDIMAGPTTPASISGWPAFVDGEDFNILLPMTYSTLWPEGGQGLDPSSQMISIGRIGCPGPVATDNESWDSLKALYK